MNNTPYLLTGIQIKPDKVIEQYSVSSDEQYEEYVKPLFQKSAELGYQTVIFPIHWKQIEKQQSVYDFNLLERYYQYAKDNKLMIQLLWFGSDSTGYGTNTPSYIRSDTATYARLEAYPNVLDYSDADLVQRECIAFEKLLEWLYLNDTEGRTLAIQLENEPNQPAYGGPTLDDTNDDTFNATTWCAGQKTAILHIINELGKLVKSGPYRCVTRVNLCNPTYLWNSTDKLNSLANEVLALEGVDMVGYDTYQTTTNDRLLTYSGDSGLNIAHWPEYGASHSNYVPSMLSALARRAGAFGYQLKATTNDTAGAIFNTTDNTWTLPTGEEYSGGYRVDANELKAVNIVLNKAGEKVVLNDVDNTAVFNIERETSGLLGILNFSETKTIDGISIEFTNSGTTGFGGCGYVTKISDNEMLIFATRGTSSFKFTGKTISAESGSYNNGVWEKEADITVSDSKITISEDMANAGTLIRVTFN